MKHVNRLNRILSLLLIICMLISTVDFVIPVGVADATPPQLTVTL